MLGEGLNPSPGKQMFLETWTGMIAEVLPNPDIYKGGILWDWSEKEK